MQSVSPVESYREVLQESNRLQESKSVTGKSYREDHGMSAVVQFQTKLKLSGNGSSF